MASPLYLQWSFLTVPCLPAFPAVRSECLAGEVEQEQGAWGDGSGRPWETAPPTYRFAFMFLFPVKICLPLFFHKTCWKQLAKSRFALVCWLLSFLGAWTWPVWSLSLVWTDTQRELRNLSLFCKRQIQKDPPLLGLCLHFISRGPLEGKWSAVRGSGLKDPNSTSSCVWTPYQLVYGGSFQTMLATMCSRTHHVHLSSEVGKNFF